MAAYSVQGNHSNQVWLNQLSCYKPDTVQCTESLNQLLWWFQSWITFNNISDYWPILDYNVWCNIYSGVRRLRLWATHGGQLEGAVTLTQGRSGCQTDVCYLLANVNHNLIFNEQIVKKLQYFTNCSNWVLKNWYINAFMYVF